MLVEWVDKYKECLDGVQQTPACLAAPLVLKELALLSASLRFAGCAQAHPWRTRSCTVRTVELEQIEVRSQSTTMCANGSIRPFKFSLGRDKILLPVGSNLQNNFGSSLQIRCCVDLIQNQLPLLMTLAHYAGCYYTVVLQSRCTSWVRYKQRTSSALNGRPNP